jgi:RNA polymerase sigma factor (sigma-70 family)
MAVTPSYERETEMEYDTLMKTALGNELKDFFKTTNRRLNKEAPFSDFDDGQIESFATSDGAFDFVDSEFQVLQYAVVVQDALLYDALSELDKLQRDVILLFYWLEMNDREIADETGVNRRKINRIRQTTHAKLKEILKGKGYDASDFVPSGKV